MSGCRCCLCRLLHCCWLGSLGGLSPLCDLCGLHLLARKLRTPLLVPALPILDLAVTAAGRGGGDEPLKRKFGLSLRHIASGKSQPSAPHPRMSTRSHLQYATALQSWQVLSWGDSLPQKEQLPRPAGRGGAMPSRGRK